MQGGDDTVVSLKLSLVCQKFPESGRVARYMAREGISKGWVVGGWVGVGGRLGPLHGWPHYSSTLAWTLLLLSLVWTHLPNGATTA